MSAPILVTHGQQRAIGIWLLICLLTVYTLIVVGGVTRLTQSGLSMVEWEPIMGVIPPLSEQEWQVAFGKYQAYPEYQKLNSNMDLAGFKRIFFWEYFHRMLGRLIGLLFFVPYLFFLLRGYLVGSWKLKLAGLFALGGLQAVMGWYMVKSGLVDNPHVSQYRLAAHFTLALLIFSTMLWFMLEFLRGNQPRDNIPSVVRRKGFAVAILVLLMMVSGAFVAGTKAGFAYNTFPLIDGAWVPDGLLALQPTWRNFFENSLTVQYVHRCFAIIVSLAVLGLAIVAWSRTRALADVSLGREALIMVLLLVCQVCIGIITLVNKVPVFWGALHQATAVALLAAVIVLLHKVSRRYDYARVTTRR